MVSKPETTETLGYIFWDDNDTEFSATDFADILDNYPSGEVVRMQRAIRLHDVFAARVGDDMREFDTMEEAEAWADAKLAQVPGDDNG